MLEYSAKPGNAIVCSTCIAIKAAIGEWDRLSHHCGSPVLICESGFNKDDTLDKRDNTRAYEIKVIINEDSKIIMIRLTEEELEKIYRILSLLFNDSLLVQEEMGKYFKIQIDRAE